MYIYDKAHETEVVEKRFCDVEPGQIFLYAGVARIKLVKPVYACEIGNERKSKGPRLIEINAMHVASTLDKRAGAGSIFSPDTIVEICPDAAIYLKG